MSSLTKNQDKGSHRDQILHQKSLTLLFHLDFLQNGDMTGSVVFENILVLMGIFAVLNTFLVFNSLGFNINFIIFSSIDQTLYWFSFTIMFCLNQDVI